MKQYEEVMLSAEELQELLVLGRQSETIRSEEVIGSLCYKKIMSLDNLTFPPLDGYARELELLADMTSKSQIKTLSLEDIMINENHKTVIANLAKSTNLHNLYIKFNNMRSDTTLASQELRESKSIKTIYVGFNSIFNHSKHYCEIIKPIVQMKTLSNLTFKFLKDYDSRFFKECYKDEISSMVDRRAEEVYMLIKEDFYVVKWDRVNTLAFRRTL